ncbi:MAG: hypothetical protein A2089_03745 [Elusimicrobia bacterium GWD2_63_28]|nr:MAG: hypothetical protein A2089_03745 [Elusimicrobia bacterium GWD2_63_28]
MTNTAMLIQKGEAYLMEEVFEPAIKCLSEAIANDSTAARAYCSRSEAYCRKAMARRGEDTPLDDAALALLKLALEDVKLAIQIDPKYMEAHHGLGWIYFEMEQYHEAIEAYGIARKLDSKDVSPYYNQAMAHIRLENWDNALKILNDVIELEPDNAEALFERATVYDALGEHDKALGDLDTAIGLKPCAKYYAYRAESVLDFGCMHCSVKSALSDLTEAIRLDPKHARSFLSRSEIYAALEDYESELSDLDSAIKVSPLFAEAYLSRYKCHKNLGNPTKAMQDWIVYSAIRAQESHFFRPVISDEIMKGAKKFCLN